MKKLFQKKIIIPAVVAAALLLAAVAGYFLLIPHFTFTVIDGENSYTLRRLQTNPEDILDKLKLTRTDADVYTTEKQKGGTLITLRRAQQIEIVVKGEKQTA